MYQLILDADFGILSVSEFSPNISVAINFAFLLAFTTAVEFSIIVYFK
jgi:hypothetical protein